MLALGDSQRLLLVDRRRAWCWQEKEGYIQGDCACPLSGRQVALELIWPESSGFKPTLEGWGMTQERRGAVFCTEAEPEQGKLRKEREVKVPDKRGGQSQQGLLLP